MPASTYGADHPVFCLTSDVDWACEHVVADMLKLVSSFDIRPTVFATHPSAVLREYEAKGKIELGIHPNFLPGSTHGQDVVSVIDHSCGLFREAKCFRSHMFVDSYIIAKELFRRGFRYDSNLCLYMQPELVPLRHESGLLRFPVFWEDDVHARRSPGIWDADALLEEFLTPGLKILNFHPIHVALNTSDDAYYAKVKDRTRTLDEQSLGELRCARKGTRTFLCRLLELLKARGQRFHTLGELYAMYTNENGEPAPDVKAGRHTAHSEEEYQQYGKMTDEQKQDFVRRDFDQRNAKDLYATSRDYNARELEISSIKQFLGPKGTVVDLGCGNGYTLLSLAKELEDWNLQGVDFSENLVRGAGELLEARQAELKSRIRLHCADAVNFVKQAETGSATNVITERFVQNLPSVSVQHEVIRNIFRMLQPGGRFLMCEGSEDGHQALNSLRTELGLPKISATSKDNVSSIRIKESELEAFAEQLGFKLLHKLGYSLYFIMTRVLHPLLVAPESPRFDAPLNDIAGRIQKSTPFLPGFGSNVLWVFEKAPL